MYLRARRGRDETHHVEIVDDYDSNSIGEKIDGDVTEIGVSQSATDVLRVGDVNGHDNLFECCNGGDVLEKGIESYNANDLIERGAREGYEVGVDYYHGIDNEMVDEISGEFDEDYFVRKGAALAGDWEDTERRANHLSTMEDPTLGPTPNSTQVPTPNETSPEAPSSATKESRGGFGFGIVWFVLALVIGFALWRVYKWYKTKNENAKQAYRMAQADRVLGDMQMVPTVDADDNELL